MTVMEGTYTGGSDDGGSGTQWVDWQWQTGHSNELHNFHTTNSKQDVNDLHAIVL